MRFSEIGDLVAAGLFRRADAGFSADSAACAKLPSGEPHNRRSREFLRVLPRSANPTVDAENCFVTSVIFSFVRLALLIPTFAFVFAMPYLAVLLPARFKPWLWAKLSSLMHLEHRLPSGIGIRIRSFSDWCIYNDIFVAGEYDRAIRSALTKALATGTFCAVDLGANVGFFTLRILDLIQRDKLHFSRIDILLVEASPHLVGELKNRLATLSLQGLKIQILHGLVGEKSGMGQFQIESAEIKNSVISGSSSNSISIDYLDLELHLSAADRIDLLKCDIEGSEAAFIHNYPSLLKRTEVAVFEFHQSAGSWVDAVTEIMNAGFTRREVVLDQGHLQTVLFQR